MESDPLEIPTASVATMYETALTIRLFEQRAIEQYRVGNVRGYLHPYLGEEGIAVGACAALRPSDYIVSTHRGHGHAIAKGHEPRLMMAELLGRATGYCRGRGGSMHVSSLALRNLGANGVVAGGMPLAAPLFSPPTLWWRSAGASCPNPEFTDEAAGCLRASLRPRPPGLRRDCVITPEGQGQEPHCRDAASFQAAVA